MVSDVDECDNNLHNCHVNADCINTIGSFYCDCRNGFNGNGTYCYGMYFLLLSYVLYVISLYLVIY